MRAPVVINSNPVANDVAGVPQRLEPRPMHISFFHCANDLLDHPVLLRAVRGDELLLQPIAAHEGRIAASGKNPTIVGPQQE